MMPRDLLFQSKIEGSTVGQAGQPISHSQQFELLGRCKKRNLSLLHHGYLSDHDERRTVTCRTVSDLHPAPVEQLDFLFRRHVESRNDAVDPFSLPSNRDASLLFG